MTIPLVDLSTLDQDISLVALKVLGLVIPKCYLQMGYLLYKPTKWISDDQVYLKFFVFGVDEKNIPLLVPLS